MGTTPTVQQPTSVTTSRVPGKVCGSTTTKEPQVPLMKKGAEYAWTPALQGAFDVAREEIMELVKSGVKSFRLGAWTCLVTDWSQRGVGFVLWQKRCTCTWVRSTCCKSGWVMVTCGSRFCTLAEARNHPIEGELLGVV